MGCYVTMETGKEVRLTAQLEMKSGVRWEVVPEIDAAQLTIAKVYTIAGSKAVVTSAHDGRHSIHSAHRQAEQNGVASAIDLRITNLFRPLAGSFRPWYGAICEFAKTLAAALNMDCKTGWFCVVVEADHLHLEFTANRHTPNIQGYKPNQYVYPTAEVRAHLEPKVPTPSNTGATP